MFLLVLGLALVVICVGLAIVDQYLARFRDSSARQANELPPGYVAQAHPAPPEPRLETTGDAVITAVRARDQKILTTYAWDDDARTLVRIPVDRAIDLVVAAGNGVPTTLPANGLVVAPSATRPTGGAP
jgi:hypothetical protein